MSRKTSSQAKYISTYGRKKLRRWKVERFFEQEGLCIWCDIEMVLTTGYTTDPMAATGEHIIPLSKGGQNVKGNVVAAHAKCNHEKGNS